ncbi:MAG: methanethiol S-methyltransferase [Pseudomonadota bacterium]
MKRALVLIYGILSYAVFFATFLYSIGFIGNFGVPKSIDSIPTVGLGVAILTNLGLLTVFALQHSVMARPWFKRILTRWIPQAAERSTYCLFASLALILLFVGWQPMGGTVWSLEAPVLRIGLYTVFALGWVLIFISTFAINHFDLFGLRQVWDYARNRTYYPPEFKEPVLYRIVRHPLYVGWLVVLWATPTMTMAHLLFALATTAYTLIAIQFEEKDLADMHPEYRVYKKRVPMLIPRFSKRKTTPRSEQVA